MFGSRKGKKSTSDSAASPEEQTVSTDQEKPKRRFWQFGRKKESTAEQVSEQSVTVAEETVLKTEEAVEETTHQETEATTKQAELTEPAQVESPESLTPAQPLESQQTPAPSDVSMASSSMGRQSVAEEPEELENKPELHSEQLIPEPVKQPVEVKPAEATDTPASPIVETAEAVQPTDEPEKPKKTGFFARMKKGLSKTRSGFVEPIHA